MSDTNDYQAQNENPAGPARMLGIVLIATLVVYAVIFGLMVLV